MTVPSDSPTKPKWFWPVLFAVLVTALSLRVAAATLWQHRLPAGESFAWGDSKTYWQIAENLVDHGDYAFGTPPKRIFRAPGYPGFLAILMMISQAVTGHALSVLTARVVGALLGTAAVAMVTLWVRQTTRDDRVAMLTALILTLYPGGIAMSVFILSEAFFLPVAVLGLWTWSQGLAATRKRHLIGWSLIAGLLAGHATLIRPSWLLFPPLAGMTMLICFPKWRTISSTLMVLIGIAAAMSPWWYRNFQLSGQFVPTTLQVGASLYDGWNPNADGSSEMRYGYAMEEAVRAQIQQEARGQGWSPDETALAQEIGANQALRDAAMTWAAAHPQQAARLFLVKVARTWRPWPSARAPGSPLVQGTVGLTMCLIVGLSLIQWRKICHSPAWFLCWFPTLYFTLLHGVFVGSVRYRQPAVFLLAPFAAAGLLWLCGRWRSQPKAPDGSNGRPLA